MTPLQQKALREHVQQDEAIPSDMERAILRGEHGVPVHVEEREEEKKREGRSCPAPPPAPPPATQPLMEAVSHSGYARFTDLGSLAPMGRPWKREKTRK